MAEYTDKEAVLKTLCAQCDALPDDGICPYRFMGCKQFYGIFSLPSADVRPMKHGTPVPHYETWLNSDMEPVKTVRLGYECPFCGCTEIKNFCPNCGADMRSKV